MGHLDPATMHSAVEVIVRLQMETLCQDIELTLLPTGKGEMLDMFCAVMRGEVTTTLWLKNTVRYTPHVKHKNNVSGRCYKSSKIVKRKQTVLILKCTVRYLFTLYSYLFIRLFTKV